MGGRGRLHRMGRGVWILVGGVCTTACVFAPMGFTSSWRSHIPREKESKPSAGAALTPTSKLAHTHLQLEHRILVGYVDERVVAVAALVRHACQVGVALLRVLADRERVVVGVGGEEMLRVVVGVDDDLAWGEAEAWWWGGHM